MCWVKNEDNFSEDEWRAAKEVKYMRDEEKKLKLRVTDIPTNTGAKRRFWI